MIRSLPPLFKLVLIGTPVAVIVALSTSFEKFSLIGSIEQPSPAAQLDFNAYSVGINTVIYDPSGEISYTLQAVRQVHYNDDSTEFDKPFVRLFQEGGSRWNLVADTGVISSAAAAKTRTIEFSGNVEVYSLDDFGNRTVMTTDKLFLNPQSETLTTDEEVIVETSSITQTAIGMVANLNSDEIVFHREIRGTYEPPLPN